MVDSKWLTVTFVPVYIHTAKKLGLLKKKKYAYILTYDFELNNITITLNHKEGSLII